MCFTSCNLESVFGGAWSFIYTRHRKGDLGSYELNPT